MPFLTIHLSDAGSHPIVFHLDGAIELLLNATKTNHTKIDKHTPCVAFSSTHSYRCKMWLPATWWDITLLVAKLSSMKERIYSHVLSKAYSIVGVEESIRSLSNARQKTCEYIFSPFFSICHSFEDRSDANHDYMHLRLT